MPVTIRLPGAVFEFDHIQYRSGGMDAVLSVWRESPTDPLEALNYDPGRCFRYHVSGRSLSNVTAYRRELEKFHGDDLRWGELLHEAIRLAETQYVEGVQSLDPWDVPEQSTAHLVEGVFPMNAVSCVFGMGGAGKSLVLEAAMAAVSNGTPWLGRATVQQNTLWLDYESEHEGDFASRRWALAQGGQDFLPGSIRWMGAGGVPLADLVETVRREMMRFHIGNLVVDSVAFACGGDPIKAEVATGFYGALAQLPVSTKILIAHTDKAENDRYPFGSIFWHNGIHGMSWFVKGVQKEDELTIGWYGRKVSNGPKQQEFATKLTFDEGIRVEAGNMKMVNQETGKGSMSDRIYDFLVDEGGQTTSELAKALKIDDGTVRTRCNELKGKGRIERNGRLWEASL